MKLTKNNETCTLEFDASQLHVLMAIANDAFVENDLEYHNHQYSRDYSTSLLRQIKEERDTALELYNTLLQITGKLTNCPW